MLQSPLVLMSRLYKTDSAFLKFGVISLFFLKQSLFQIIFRSVINIMSNLAGWGSLDMHYHIL